jgi:hypothetical protein
MELLTLLRKCVGFQPISAAFLIAWAANFAVVMSTISRLHLDDVRVDGRLGHLIGVFQALEISFP